MRKTLLLLLSLSLGFLGSGSNNLFARPGYFKADPVLSNIGSKVGTSFFKANTAFAKFTAGQSLTANSGLVVAAPVISCPLGAPGTIFIVDSSFTSTGTLACNAVIDVPIPTVTYSGVQADLTRSWIIRDTLTNTIRQTSPAGDNPLISGFELAAGAYTVEYTVKEKNAPFASDVCTFYIGVYDDVAPKVTTPVLDTTIYLVPGDLCATNYAITTSTVVDDCGFTTAASITRPDGSSTNAVADPFVLGVHVVNFTFTDAQGNKATDSYSVTVLDTLKPSIVLFNETHVTAGDTSKYVLALGSCSLSDTLYVNAFDNCRKLKSVTANGQSMIYDAVTNRYKFKFTVSGGADDTTYSNIVIVATDSSDNSFSSTAVVRLIDNNNPVFLNTQAPLSIFGADNNVCSFTKIYNIANDFKPSHPCGIDSVVFFVNGVRNGAVVPAVTNSYTIVFPKGLTNVEVRAYKNFDLNNITAGNADNVVSQLFDVRVDDIQKPEVFVTVQNDTIYGFLDPLACTSTFVSVKAQLGTGVNGAADNCSSDAYLNTTINNNRTGSTFDASGFYNLGATKVIFTVTDESGNIGTDSVIVFVQDITSPDLGQDTTNFELFVDAGVCSKITDVNPPVAFDACGIASVKYILNNKIADTLKLTTPFINDTTLNKGVTTYTWIITDLSGNVAIATHIYTVKDAQNPTFVTVVPNQTVFAGLDSCSVSKSYKFVTADNCGVQQITYYIANPLADTVKATVLSNQVIFNREFLSGLTRIGITVSDSSANTNTLVFEVTVLDNQKPKLVLPDTVTFGTADALCSTKIQLVQGNKFLGVDMFDNCAIDTVTARIIKDNGVVANKMITAYSDTAHTYIKGATSIEYSIIDASGNLTKDTVVINVKDLVNPVITSAPGNDTILTLLNECSKIVNYATPTASDNCSSIASIVRIAGKASGDQFTLGNNIITYRVTDAAGNVTDTTFNIVIVDKQRPVIKNTFADTTISFAADKCGSQYVYAVEAQDNCDAQGTITSATYPSGFVFDSVGVFTNVIFVKDISGNVSDTITYKITVIDNFGPVFTSFPANIVTCNSAISYVEPTFTDNCPGVTITSDKTINGTTQVPGNYTVTYTITDKHGKQTSKVLSIVVKQATTIANAGADIEVCEGSAITLNGNTPSNGESGKWSGNGVIFANDASNTTTITGNPGIYNLTWTITGDALCAVTTDVVSVKINANPSAAQIAGATSITVNTLPATISAINPQVGSGIWSTTDVATISNPTSPVTTVDGIADSATVTFTWTVSATGCASKSANLTVTYVPTKVSVDFAASIPTAFTPNNDGSNDTWNIPGMGAYPNATVEVFNRWGQLVYEANGSTFAASGWNGTKEGEELSVASYYYVINLADGSPEYKGFVSIIR